MKLGIYFEKFALDEITQPEFNLGTATTYFNTMEHGISILIVQPWQGSKTADLRSQEQAVQLTKKNYTLSDVVEISKKDPHSPTSTYQ